MLSVIESVTGKLAKVNYTPARKLDVPVNFLDITRANSELLWHPEITLEEGIARTSSALQEL